MDDLIFAAAVAFAFSESREISAGSSIGFMVVLRVSSAENLCYRGGLVSISGHLR